MPLVSVPLRSTVSTTNMHITKIYGHTNTETLLKMISYHSYVNAIYKNRMRALLSVIFS